MSEKYVEWFVRVVPPRGSTPNNTLGNIRVAATSNVSSSVELDNDVGLFAFVGAGPLGNSTQSIGPAILRVQAELADVYINFSTAAGTANSLATTGNTRASIVPAGQDRDFEVNPSVDKFLNFATINTGITTGFIRYWVTTFPQSSSVFGA